MSPVERNAIFDTVEPRIKAIAATAFKRDRRTFQTFDEAYQSACMHAIEAIDRYDSDKGPIPNFVSRSVRLALMGDGRRQRLLASREHQVESMHVFAEESEIEDVDIYDVVARAVMTSEDRNIMNLHMKYIGEENPGVLVAQDLGVHPSTVTRAITRAYAAVKEVIVNDRD